SHLPVVVYPVCSFYLFFLFLALATAVIYTLSLHDALPISDRTWISLESQAPPSATTPARTCVSAVAPPTCAVCSSAGSRSRSASDRKSTRLNSSHGSISYAVFCLKKKNKKETNNIVYDHKY